jgi:hypothetical protein
LLLAAGLLVTATGEVAAQTPEPSLKPDPQQTRSAESAAPSRHLIETGRTEAEPLNRDRVRLRLRGEYQLRFSALTELALRPPPYAPTSTSLGQRTRLQHWHRITPEFQLRERMQLVAQADLPRGLIGGQEAQFVDAADQPLNDRQPLRASLRWLYAEWRVPAAQMRVGQQPSHLGLGIVENDGNHPALFGDYQGGSRAERLQLTFKPLGAASGWSLRVAGDVVAKDPWADLSEDEVALRGLLAISYDDGRDHLLSAYGALRSQQRIEDSHLEPESQEQLTLVTLDLSGRHSTDLPGGQGSLFGEYEAAVRMGDTTILRSVWQQQTGEREKIMAYGGAARVGFVATTASEQGEWGHFAAAVEWGWASGDADPNDGTYRRFDFDPSHNVGLILFDEVLAWKTARSASIAQNANLAARSAPGASLLASNGAVFGATYVHPSLVVRPLRPLDLRLGAVVAQATADLVDPMLVTSDGTFNNYDGGDPTSHDLGLELDTAVEYRVTFDHGLVLRIGTQGGVFFPGNAFADGDGRRLERQWIGIGRLGLGY